MIIIKKKENGKGQVIGQESLEVVMSEENLKNVRIFFLLKEGHAPMTMRPIRTRKCHLYAGIM